MTFFLAFFNVLLIIFSVYVPLAGPQSPWLTSAICKHVFVGPVVIIHTVLFLSLSIICSIANFKPSSKIHRLCRILVVLNVFSLAFFHLFVVMATQGPTQAPTLDEAIYKLSDYSILYRSILRNDGVWAALKNCVGLEKICQFLAIESVGMKIEDFKRKQLTPIQSGCCKPPSSCGFLYVNATKWTPLSHILLEQDCQLWSNEKDRLCFDCQSCQAGFMEEVRRPWRSIIASSISPFFWSTIFQYLLVVLASKKD